MKEKTTRLELLKQGAMAFAVLAVGGLLPISVLGKTAKKTVKGSSSKIKFDEVFDVIVVGSGLAGSVAAMTAVEKGNKVLIAEKMEYLGGSSINQEFHFSCPGSAEQKQKGIKDSPEILIKDLQKVGENYGAPELIKEMAKNSPRFYQLLSKLGITFEQLKPLRGHSVPRTLWLADGGKKVLEKMHTYLNGKCEIRKQVKVDEVLTDANGRVIGVKVREQYVSSKTHDDDLINRSGVFKVYGATKGIILANGGFAHDKAFISGEANYFGKLSELSGSAHPGSTAGLLKAMIVKGAHPVNTSLYHFAYPLYERDFYYGLMVDAAGSRIADEGNPNKFGRIAFKSKNKLGGKSPICVFDKTGFELISDKQRRDAAVQAGSLQQFASIEELSSAYSIPVVALAKTIADYHQTIDSKKDEVFMKMVGELNGAAVKNAPFYVIKVEPELNYTTGGLRIDPKARVLKMATGKPFKGLFAAGEAVGGVHGAQIIEGMCTLDCGTFGMIAGEQAAAMEAVKLN
ncbi:Fumarate reductase flavoprotein subunit [Neobacillus rhizosphaerae]|uniref:Fumarate reductase flavoprotein subunit n=1 Tax=Neobacillus rhizosphaerae TaxID=2880965 RepID=A0ABN8KP90_9BACI|nr:FAD-binding protein [Neobacillus rhizosphaerae]CAH2714050.1 Fumarate reductase flavoprotein subunit [Neobacillus rhizosphaerae]